MTGHHKRYAKRMLPKVMFNRWGASAPATPPGRITHWFTQTWLGAGARRVLISGGVIGGIGYMSNRKRDQRTQLPSKVLLSLDLTTVQLVEKAPTPQAKLAAKLGDEAVQQMLLRDACAAIRSAATDERVVGLVAQLGSAPGADASLAQCQELSDAVSEFRAKKPKAVTIAHADSLGGLHYLLASSFEKVYVQPGSLVELPSFSREQPFLKAFLARWGLRLEAIAREEYKSAAAAFTDDGVTPASMKGSRWLRACFEQAVAQIGAARGLSQVQVARLARRGMLSSDEAVRTKLLDGTLYQDEAEALAKKVAGTSSAAVTLARYHEARGASRQRRESDERTASYKARARILATLPADAAGLAVHAVGAVFGAASTLDVATWPAPPQLLTSAGVQLRQLTNFGGGAAVERAAAEAAAAEAEKAAAEKATAERAALLKTRSGRRQAAREAKVAAKKEAADKQAAAAAEAVKAEAAALKVTLTLTP